MTTTTGHGTASTCAAQQKTARVKVVAQAQGTRITGAARAAMTGACPGQRR